MSTRCGASGAVRALRRARQFRKERSCRFARLPEPPPRQRLVPAMTVEAAHENEFAHGPADFFNGLAQGFRYNAGRAIGSFFPTMVGFVSQTLPLGTTIAVFSAFASGLMVVMLLLLPETRGR